MDQVGELEIEVERLRRRLSRLSEASLRINESLDFETVLQGILDSARSLTGAAFGLLILRDDLGQEQDFLASGLTPVEHELFMEWSKQEPALFEFLNRISGPLRSADFNKDATSAGFPMFLPPITSNCPTPYLAAPILYQGATVGSIYVLDTVAHSEFSPEDEETLVAFASQAAMVIANARRYRDEQRARADLETVINTSLVGVLVFDAATGEVVSTNQEAKRIASELHAPDLPMDEIISAVTVRRADGREITMEKLFLIEELNTGGTVRVEEIEIESPNGKNMTVLINATPIFSSDGSVESVVVTLQDMTPLEDLERHRTEFVGMVSHELRTPLTAIKGSATTLMESSYDLEPAEMREFFRIINEQADQMRNLIGDLLDVTRIETGTLSVDPKSVDVASLVDEARSRFLSANGRESLHIDLAANLPPVMADRRRILQVLGNLLANASQHSPEFSTITMTAEQEDVWVAISVSDPGRGVAPERLPYLFRKFSRLHEDGSSRTGSGLGLAICKGIMEAHGGRIWAESEGPGLGSKFTLTIPVAEDSEEITAEAPAPHPNTAQELRRILAVDDDPHALRYVRQTLAKAGYDPIVTGDPDDVPHLIKEYNPDLVLLDLMLPASDGIKLMPRILNITDAPVIFLSAYAQDDVIARAFDTGAVDYIVKPFSPTELTARIRAALRERAALGQDETPEPFVLGELAINYLHRSVTLAKEPVRLTSTEYRLLSELSRNAGRVMTHNQLLRRIWGLGGGSDLRPMRTAIKSLRQKLGDNASDPTYIFTETRTGYRMAKL